MNDLYNKYDKVSEVVLINLYTLSKKEQIVNLGNVNLKDKEHLYILMMVQNVNSVFGFEVRVEMNWFKLWRYNKKHNTAFKHLKSGEKGIHINSFLDHIRMANSLEPNFFADIYDAYYSKGDN